MLNIDKLSYWERKSFFENVDHLIIGAGIVGYSTALHLKEIDPNSKILIIEQGFLPSGASSKNAGFACFGSATELYDDIQKFGEDLVWETVQLRWKGLQFLRNLLGDSALDLQINGSWDLITDEEIEIYTNTLAKLDYFNAKLKEITGIENVYSKETNIDKKFGFKGVIAAIHNQLEGQIDTSKMNDAFYRLLIQKGINVLFGIRAESISDSASQAMLRTTIGDISSQTISICTNGFAKQFLPDEDVLPARAQVLITKPIKELRIKGTFHYQQGYYYFRNIDDRILFGGGRNLDKEGETSTEFINTELIQSRLSELLKTVILPDYEFEIDYYWAGIMGVGNDKKPIIKQVSPHVFCGVRLGGMGVAIGSLVGKEIVGLINQSKIVRA